MNFNFAGEMLELRKGEHLTDQSGRTWEYVDDVDIEDRRWMKSKMLIVKSQRSGNLFALYYEVPLTESSGDFGWIYYNSDGIILIPVEAVEVIKVEYRRK